MSAGKMEAKPYVNGSMLQNNIGNSVCLIGKISQMNPNGMELRVQASDGKEIKVVLEDQLEEPLDGYVQLYGRVNQDSSITSERLVSFGTGEIDLDVYNKAITLMSAHQNLFSASEVNGMMH